ncbi:MAG TPA: hypothetical protein VKB35_03260, partial [Ktedonobacteraceae bacterium]|nr:hypothetical protein [Ktedonobacteraceae bacterium]
MEKGCANSTSPAVYPTPWSVGTSSTWPPKRHGTYAWSTLRPLWTEAVLYAERGVPDPQVYLGGYINKYDFAFPDFPELPGYRVSGYRGEQRHFLEVWCEKSTMNDILVSLCQRYGVNLQIGSGELSITSALSVVNRLQEA